MEHQVINLVHNATEAVFANSVVVEANDNIIGEEISSPLLHKELDMLTIYQKSVYLLILNATMILRSIGHPLHRNNAALTVRDFKIQLFSKIENLTSLIEANAFTENELINSIVDLANHFSISIGQSQKAINVILKYHYHLSRMNNNDIKRILHCPIDSKILEVLGIINLRLNAINLEKYLEIQNRISAITPYRIDFDSHWDNQHLDDEGLL